MNMALYRIPHQYEYHGITFNKKDFPPELLDETRNTLLRSGDILALTFPRTGTTLIAHTISLIMCNNKVQREETEKVLLNKRFWFLERKGDVDMMAKFKGHQGPRYIQSHLPPFLTENWWGNDKGHIVSVLRNPKDTLVSMFHFYRGMELFGNFPGTWDEFFALYKAGCIYIGDCIDWSLGMWKLRNRDNVHVMIYEDIVKHPKEEIAKLANFLGVQRSEDDVEDIANRTSLKSMKGNSATNYKHKGFLHEDFEFVRKGKIGDWMEYFTEEQNIWMDERIMQTLKGSGLEFQYE